MYKTRQEITQWLDEFQIKDYHINEDFSINVIGDVFLTDKQLEEFPVQFNI